MDDRRFKTHTKALNGHQLLENALYVRFGKDKLQKMTFIYLIKPTAIIVKLTKKNYTIENTDYPTPRTKRTSPTP